MGSIFTLFKGDTNLKLMELNSKIQKNLNLGPVENNPIEDNISTEILQKKR